MSSVGMLRMVIWYVLFEEGTIVIRMANVSHAAVARSL